jgi:hypothetical protein
VDRRELSSQEIDAIENEVKVMLHCHRDCLRNRGVDTTRIAFDAREGYYGEAFGIMRALAVLGYGRIDQAVNTPETRRNLKWWFAELERAVLDQENFGGSGICFHCRKRYGKDDATVSRFESGVLDYS